MPTPRPRVPAGSVAMAGRLTGVYPFASPGGWNLIGRTDRVLFDPFADEPALIQPGDRVRFLASDLPVDADYPRTQPFPASVAHARGRRRRAAHDRPGRRAARPSPPRRARGAASWIRTRAHAANRAVGNPEDAALLECTATGPTLRFGATTRFAIAGADLGAVLERADLGALAGAERPRGRGAHRQRPLHARPPVAACARMSPSRAASPCPTSWDRAPPTSWPASGDTTAGRSRPATISRWGAHRRDRRSPPSGLAPPAPRPVVLRAVAGPQDDMFTDEARARLESETYEVSPLSDRIGCRLAGPALAHRAAGEILTDGMVPGCIQVPPNGQPIVVLGDGPTTGGYPKIATVVSADLGRLGQLVAGDPVRFRLVTIEEAQRDVGTGRNEPAPARGARSRRVDGPPARARRPGRRRASIPVRPFPASEGPGSLPDDIGAYVPWRGHRRPVGAALRARVRARRDGARRSRNPGPRRQPAGRACPKASSACRPCGCSACTAARSRKCRPRSASSGGSNT